MPHDATATPRPLPSLPPRPLALFRSNLHPPEPPHLSFPPSPPAHPSPPVTPTPTPAHPQVLKAAKTDPESQRNLKNVFRFKDTAQVRAQAAGMSHARGWEVGLRPVLWFRGQNAHSVGVLG